MGRDTLGRSESARTGVDVSLVDVELKLRRNSTKGAPPTVAVSAKLRRIMILRVFLSIMSAAAVRLYLFRFLR